MRAQDAPTTDVATLVVSVRRMAQPRTISTDTEPAELIALRISAKQRRALQRLAKREQVSVSQLLRNLIEEAVSA